MSADADIRQISLHILPLRPLRVSPLRFATGINATHIDSLQKRRGKNVFILK